MIKSSTRDLAPDRQHRLREYLRQQGSARVDAICRALRMSPATARRDLERLEEQGWIRRVHGGAMSVESRLEEPVFDAKASRATREKRAIAEKAAALVGAGSTLYLDGGSTALELARLLAERADLTVVTNSLRAAAELASRGPKLVLVGGELRRLSQTMVGPLTEALLAQLHFDTAFMGTLGFSVRDGLTTTDPGEAYTKRVAMARADRVVLLADSSKHGTAQLARSGGLDEVDVLITDRRLPPSFDQEARDDKLELQVIRV
jgi:DeoR/GlpR family transcriptional regulator of sugar metabolism